MEQADLNEETRHCLNLVSLYNLFEKNEKCLMMDLK